MRRRDRFGRRIQRAVRALTFSIRGRRIHPAGVLAVVVMLGLTFWLGSGDVQAGARNRIFDAIRFVESGHRENPPDGDDGKAIGPYQIHRVYWIDAAEFDESLGGTYQDCRRQEYAERVIASYMRRHVPDAWAAADAEIIARTHNGGPRGATKRATVKYWNKVRQALEDSS